MDSNFIVKTNSLYKSYRMGTTEVSVLKGVNLSIRKGEFVAIIGTSGSGKSTLLHTLGALDNPDKGTVHFENQDLQTLTCAGLNKFRNKKVGFVFQFYHLLDELNVLENVMLPAMASTGLIGWFLTRKKTTARANDLLDRFGLSKRANHKPYQLSGGERQRTAIARALINQPALLLADEPTGNLDSVTGNGILTVFEELNKLGQTIIMVTHDERIAERAKRIITLCDGKITEN